MLYWARTLARVLSTSPKAWETAEQEALGGGVLAFMESQALHSFFVESEVEEVYVSWVF